jgi:hypothetical protein
MLKNNLQFLLSIGVALVAFAINAQAKDILLLRQDVFAMRTVEQNNKFLDQDARAAWIKLSKRGKDLIERDNNIDAIAVTKDGSWYFRMSENSETSSLYSDASEPRQVEDSDLLWRILGDKSVDKLRSFFAAALLDGQNINGVKDYVISSVKSIDEMPASTADDRAVKSWLLGIVGAKLIGSSPEAIKGKGLSEDEIDLVNQAKALAIQQRNDSLNNLDQVVKMGGDAPQIMLPQSETLNASAASPAQSTISRDASHIITAVPVQSGTIFFAKPTDRFKADVRVKDAIKRAEFYVPSGSDKVYLIKSQATSQAVGS